MNRDNPYNRPPGRNGGARDSGKHGSQWHNEQRADSDDQSGSSYNARQAGAYSGRPDRRPEGNLRDHAGVQRDAWGRYDEDDWQPRENRARNEWGYGDYEAERGTAGWSGNDSAYGAQRPRGDFRDHYGSARGHSHDGAMHGRYGYAEQTSGQPGSGAYGTPRGRPGEDFRGRGPKGYVRSDERIREEISERLSADPYIDASDIDVVVKDGVVTLSGRIDQRQTKHRVEDLTENCLGVREIENQLRVGSRSSDAGPVDNT